MALQLWGQQLSIGRLGVRVPLFKNGDGRMYSNFRGITLLAVPAVMATATRTTEDSTTPRPHPTAAPGPSQSYQGVPYQPVPEQPHYPAQPGDPAPYDDPAEPMTTSWNHEQPLQLPPSYQDATGPAYPYQPMPSSQPAYLLNPLAQPQPNALPDSTDFLAHTACSPEFALR